MNKGRAIYPGSFDPPTNGHLDLIQRGSKIFEELVVAILRNSEKSPMFSVAERLEMLRALTADLPGTYVFGCFFHYGAPMRGVIIVQ